MQASTARLVVVNHIALELGDVEEVPHFFEGVFDFGLRDAHKDDDGRTNMAFIDFGDQFLALIGGLTQTPTRGAVSASGGRPQVMPMANSFWKRCSHRCWCGLFPFG